ncbi:MAG: hypothetical protein KZQ63_19870, partial [Candidatus Thiodiazotropha sp. (ex Lucinoma aequizonata)]|nr:hypothetical protein [Candidatus Thiodiazotropha sp. (ex Lucinoma aequizonata)]MCU7913997.1 hypothetical protein [Candidatus Thiodiazotropha sp. (ex Lucinoma aequizonata)]
SACIDNEARYNQARQYGFSEKMSFLPGTSYFTSNYWVSTGRLHQFEENPYSTSDSRMIKS